MPFKIRINGERNSRWLNVKTSVYQVAVAAVPAMFGKGLPCTVEIWSPEVLPEYGPYFYSVDRDEYGRVVVNHVVNQQFASREGK